MVDSVKENFCCSQMFPITPGVFLIVGHSFLHATYSILLVITTYYRNKNNAVNIITIGANVGIFPAGIILFGTTLYNNYRAANFAAFFFTIVTALNFGAVLCYSIWYINFEANSYLDRAFFWKNEDDWVSYGQMPFTIWHILIFSVIIVLIVWWYYSCILFKYAKILKLKNELEKNPSLSEQTPVAVTKPLQTLTL